jgi:hypothetical protein
MNRIFHECSHEDAREVRDGPTSEKSELRAVVLGVNQRGPSESALLHEAYPNDTIEELVRTGRKETYTIFNIQPDGRRFAVANIVSGDLRPIPGVLTSVSPLFADRCVAMALVHSVIRA